ncbi:response regulator [Armatimonas sp.]|uniref:response regulator n=1 Tax=Armatimonas sp. TaxID=1872638 RepID=UPI00286BAF81|nr:response regulator [Armatimonas sp.]
MKTILVADDEINISRLIQVNLERAGYWVETVENGQQAWERLQQGGIDLLITDGVMPQLNGLELVEKIQANPVLRSVPICLTQLPLYNNRYYEEQITEALMRFQVAAIVPKPFNPKELLLTVNRLLRTS